MNKIKFFVVIVMISFSCVIWKLTRPVEIIAVHDGNTLLVKNFPLFKYQQISWWEENKKIFMKNIKSLHLMPMANTWCLF
ncbi:hypothetical protein SPM24T3_15076 [Serratia sp. M24T3]|nr:hypothetical protein SPM24T3_15076 [Serratia sp. M24T3]